MKLKVEFNGSVRTVNLGLKMDCLLNNRVTRSNQALSCYSNNEDIAKDYDIFFDNYEFCNEVIYNLINSKEDIDLSYDYCRILTSPWALTFSMIVFERYKSIYKLIGNKSLTIENNSLNPSFVLDRAADLFSYSQSDKFNNQIIIQILSAIENYRGAENSSIIKCIIEENEFFNKSRLIDSDNPLPKNKFTQKVIDFIKYKLTKFIENLMNLRILRSSKVLFLLPEFSISDLTRIFFHQKFAFKIVHSIKIPKVKSAIKKRDFSGFSKVTINSELSFVLQELILKNLPMEFFENLNEYKASAQSYIRKDVSRIITRSPTDTNPVVRHIMAFAHDMKILSISMQHGGGYNNYENHPLDLLERSLVDNYLVWGDISIKPSKVVGITKTSWFNLFSNNYYNSHGNLLIISPPLRRYYAGDFSYPTSFVFAYQKNMFKFINYFNNSIHKKIVYRMGWDFGVAEAEWVKGITSEITISTRENVSHAFKLVINSRLVVCTYNSSMWLELSQLNHPFILVLDKRYDLLTSLNENVFSEMEENNMLFYNSEDAAIHVSSCFNDPYHWWNTKKVQSTRLLITKAFCDSFNPLEFAKSI